MFLLQGKSTPLALSRRMILSRCASAFTSAVSPSKVSNSSGAPPIGVSGPSSTAMTPSIVNGPLTRTTFFVGSGLSTSSSISALLAMQAFTSSIFARHAVRKAVSASCNGLDHSVSVSKGTSHSFQLPFGIAAR